jgi:hypothetical protein
MNLIRRGQGRGSTIIEMMIVVVLLSLMMVMLAQILTTEGKIFRIQNEQNTVNQSALRSTVRLKRDLSESSIYSVYLYSPSTSTPGIVFMSPREALNNTTAGVDYNPNPNSSPTPLAGRLQWQSYIWYCCVTDPTDTSKYILKRRVKATGPANVPAYSTATTGFPDGQLIAQDILTMDIHWCNKGSNGAPPYSYNEFQPGTYDPLVYISICCKRQNVTSLRKRGVGRYDEVIYGIDKIFCMNNQRSDGTD